MALPHSNGAKLHAQMRAIMLETAQQGDEPLANAEAVETFNRLQVLAEKFSLARSEAEKKRILGEIKAYSQSASKEQLLAVSRLLAVDAILQNAIYNLELTANMPSPQERITAFFEQVLSAGTPLEALTEAKEVQVLSLLHTMHPVIFHTPEARASERWLIRTLERQREAIARHGGKLPPEEEERFRSWMNINVDKMAKGATVTPFNRTTVATENLIERENIEEIARHIEKVIADWNAAIRQLGKKRGEDLSSLIITDDQAASMVKLRTWGRGADADGRPNATSIELWQGLALGIKDDAYTGPTFDLRQNAREHMNLLSALIQTQHKQTGAFRKFTQAFMRGEGRSTGKEYDPDRNLFQELSEADQLAFVKALITQGWQLVPEAMEQHTLEFNQAYFDLLQAFKEKHELDAHASYQQLHPDKERNLELQEKFRSELLEQEIYHLDEDGLGYYSKDDARNTGTPLFKNRVKLSEGKHMPITDPEKTVLIDVLKRLFVVNHFVKGYGNAVADRHQIANFSSPVDYYNMLYLFSQTGLVDIDRSTGQPLVTSSKLHIQPLLETAEDMRRGPAMFEEMLKDPLIRSFYKSRGDVAEIMLGFSDGAKSAGNLASQWEIYKCANELHAVFAKHGIKAQFLQGRGRGYDRGGLLDAEHAMQSMPDSAAATGHQDFTIQADLPTHMANSPAYGKDYITGMLLGGLQATLEARREKTPQEQAEKASIEKAISFLADASEKKYVQLVLQTKLGEHERKAVAYIKTMPLNDARSSRPPKRGAKVKEKFDDWRAIDTEYRFKLTGLCAHDVGLYTAINAFITENKGITTKSGETMRGMDALKHMYKSNNFFRIQVDTRIAGLAQSQQLIAEEYAKRSGTDAYVAAIQAEIAGTTGLLDEIRGNGHHRRREDGSVKATTGSSASDGAIISQGLLLGRTGNKPDPALDPDGSKTVNNLVFTLAMQFFRAGGTRILQLFSPIKSA